MKKLITCFLAIMSLMTFLSCSKKIANDIDINQIPLDNLIDCDCSLISKKIVKDDKLTKAQLLISCSNLTDDDYKTFSKKAFQKLNEYIEDLYEVEIAFINENSAVNEFNGEYVDGVQKICRYNKRNNGTLYSYLKINSKDKLKNIKYNIEDNVIERNNQKIFNVSLDTKSALIDDDILNFSNQLTQSIKDLNSNSDLSSCILQLHYNDSLYEFISGFNDTLSKIEKF